MNRYSFQFLRVQSFFYSKNASKIRKVSVLFFYALLTFCIGYPLALLQRILFFKFKSRVCIFPTNYLGHFVFEADRYVSLNFDHGYKTFFTTQLNTANSYFLKILKQRLRFYPRALIVPVYIANYTLPDRHNYILKLGSVVGMPDVELVRHSNVWFPIDNLKVSFIKSKFYNNGYSKPIVTFFLRDNDFRSRKSDPTNDISSNYRDVSLINYVPLARNLSQKFSVIKMGRNSENFLDLNNDYWYNYSVSEDQSDFNDFLIAGNSDICVTTDSGSLAIPLLFRKKIVQTNLSLFGLVEGPSSTIVMLKDYRDMSSGKFLSLRELVKLNVHRITDQVILDSLGVEVIENSPEDLSFLAHEIDQIYSEIWRPSELNLNVLFKIQTQFPADFVIPKETYFANSWISSRGSFFV